MRRLAPLFLAGFIVLVAGLFARNGLVLLLLIPLLLVIGQAVLFGPEELDLRVVRTLSTDRGSAGSRVDVTVTVTNQGERRLEEVGVQLTPPRYLAVIEGETSALTSLQPDETVTLQYTVEGRRGAYQFQDVEITAIDHLDMLPQHATITPEGGHELDVLPGTTKLPDIAIRPLQTRVYAGNIPARLGGPGLEFFGVREYQPGDSLRDINWRASARHPGKLFTNEYEQERIADVGVILDARRRVNEVMAGRTLFEHGVDAAAAIAESFLNAGNRVSLLIYGQFIDWTPPGYSKLGRERILRALAQATMGGSQVFDALENLPTRFFPAKSQLVVVSPMAGEPADPLIGLRGRAYEILLVSPDPISYEAKILEGQPGVELAERIARVERKLLMRRLRGAGIRTVDWDVTRYPLAPAISASLARQPARPSPFGR